MEFVEFLWEMKEFIVNFVHGSFSGFFGIS